MIPSLPRVLLLVHFFGEAPERRPWIPEHEDAGRSLPGFIFAFAFLWSGLTHRLCYRAKLTRCPRVLSLTLC
jgi:hypothetical protein